MQRLRSKRQVLTQVGLQAEPSAEAKDGELLQLALAYYSSARAELIQRIIQRDTVLALFLGSVAAIYGVALHNLDANYALLYVIPLLGFGASCVHSQHTRVIGAIGNYLTAELEKSVKTVLRQRDLPIQWDNSVALLSARGTISYRFLASIALLIFPQVIAIVLADYAARSLSLVVLATIMSSAFATVSLLIEAFSYRRRSQWDETRRARFRVK